MREIEILHFLSIISSTKYNSVNVPVIVECLVLNEIVHLLFLLDPRSIEPLLHFLRNRIQIVSPLTYYLCQRIDINMKVASDRNSLHIIHTSSHNPEEAVIDVGEVYINRTFIVVSTDFTWITLKLHRRVIQIDRFTARFLPLTNLLDDECETSRSR